MFCPYDSCSKATFPSLPFGLIGSAGAFSNGVTFICGGARTAYTGCTANPAGNHCARNAECVTTAGGSLWCTGPKISTCFTFDRYLTKSWVQNSKSLSTPRAYAASVILPDGRLWMLGGAGSSSVLKSTEFIQTTESGISSILAGPDLPEPLMGHCAAVLSTVQVIVLGEFSALTNDFSTKAFIYDFSASQWRKSASGSGRLDGSCLNTVVAGSRQVMMTGGWSNLALSDTLYYSKDADRWISLNGTGSGSPLPIPMRSSVLIERNQTSILIGGSTCDANGRSCKQTDKSNYIEREVFSTSLLNTRFPPARPSCLSFLHRLAFLTGAW